MKQDIRTLIYPVKDAQPLLDVLSPALGRRSVEQPYYVAFRLGDRKIALDPMDVFPVLERNSTLPAQRRPFV